MAEKPKAEVELDPSDSLSFTLVGGTAPEATLLIRNVSSAKVAFKVKTTQPRRYLVRPNQGMLDLNASSQITVILQQRDCDDLLAADPRDRDQSNDKFLVQSMALENDFYQTVVDKTPKEQADDLAQMWAKANKKDLSNKKLRCSFTLPSSTRPDAQASGEAPRKTEMLKNALLAGQQNLTGESGKSDGSQMLNEVASLRKKYDELVAFTVQLTAQRDQLMNDLEKSKQKALKYQAEAEKAKESGLRQRNRGSTDISAAATSDAAMKKGQVEAGFKLFHLIVAALFAFLIGKYLT